MHLQFFEAPIIPTAAIGMGAASNGFYEACTMRGGRDSEIKTELSSLGVHSECPGLESVCGANDYVGSRARGTLALQAQLAPTSSPGLFMPERDIDMGLQDDMWSFMEGSATYCQTLGMPALRSSDTGCVDRPNTAPVRGGVGKLQE